MMLRCKYFGLVLILISQTLMNTYAQTIKLEADIDELAIQSITEYSIDIMRMISKTGEISLVPYEEHKDSLVALYLLDESKVRRVELKYDIKAAKVGSGCLNSSRKEISFPDISKKDSSIYLNTLGILNNSHQRINLKLQNTSVIWAGYDCDALLIWDLQNSGDQLSYQIIKDSQLVAEGSWSHSLNDLIKNEKSFRIESVHLESGMINVILASNTAKTRGLITISKNGHVNRIELVAKELSGQILGIDETSYGYVAVQRKNFFDRASKYKIFDSNFKLLGSIKESNLYAPRVRTPDMRTYITMEPSEDKGKPVLMVFTSDLYGHLSHYPIVSLKNEKLKDVIFSSSLLGNIGGKLIGLALGTKLQKNEKGYLLKDYLYYFPVYIAQ